MSKKSERSSPTSDLLARLSLTGVGDAPSSTAHAPDAKPSRQSRTRASTRQKLINAALKVVSEKGLDGTAIADITDVADVGVGSFYNHFSSKDEIALAVFLVRAEDLAHINDEIAEQESDPADVIVHILRIFLTRAVSDPVWGWFLVRASDGLPETASVFMMRARRDVRRGMSEGRFHVVEDETAATILMATMLAIMKLILEGHARETVVSETIEYSLRMLGIDRDEARVLADKPLPDYVTQALDM